MFKPSLITVVCCAVLQLTIPVRADDGDASLHQQIDRMIAKATPDYGQHASVLSSDAEFLRRICLDLTGRIPSPQLARDFFNDNDADKRGRLIDRLLQTPEHVRHLQHHFDVMLMQRRPKIHVGLPEWREYLFTSLRENKSWDVLVREMLSADGVEAENRAAARFLLDRELKPEATTRDLGRVFLGRDLECAQCHDHPSIDDYAQRHYFGLNAFLNRSYLFTVPKTKLKVIGEKADGTVKFTSVFTNVEGETPPRMLDLPPFADPTPEKDPYVVKPEKTNRGVPKYSRRLLLARAVTSPDNRAFPLNIANRLWALVMGRGLVEPLDMFHSDNPATHPAVLELLADDLVRHDYDMRRAIREMVLTETYQRSSRLKDDYVSETEQYCAGLLKPLSPEQLAWSMMQACGVVQKAKDGVEAKLQKEESRIESHSAEFAFRAEALVNKELSPHVETFVGVFASANESSRFDATADQALFVLNGALIGEWLKPSGNNLMSRLLNCENDGEVTEELFLTLLTRFPTEAEVESMSSFLKAGGEDRTAALRQAARSILCSAEFRFNH